MPSLKDIKGLGPKSIAKLEENGITSIDQIAGMDPTELMRITSWGKALCERVIKDAKALSIDNLIPLRTAAEVEEERKSKVKYYSTGCVDLDKILGGGVETDCILGVAGHLGSGKTNFCFSVGVSCIQEGRKVVYIETEPGIFRLDRVLEIAKNRNVDMDPNDFLVVDAKVIDNDPEKLLLSYDRVEKAVKNGMDIGLLCVDSFAAPIRSFYVGRQSLGDRSKMISRHIRSLQKLAAKHNLAVILTDQVMSQPVAEPALQAMTEAIYGTHKIPVLGDTLLHSVTIWLSLERRGKKKWRGIAFDAPHLPIGEAFFCIGPAGIQKI